MTVGEAKNIVSKVEFDQDVISKLAELWGDDENRKLSGNEIRNTVDLLEGEIRNTRGVIERLDEAVLIMNGFLNEANESSKMLDKEISSVLE